MVPEMKRSQREAWFPPGSGPQARRGFPDTHRDTMTDHGDGLGFSLERLPAKLDGRTLYRLYSPEEHKVIGRRMADGIKPREVHVYATSRRFEDPLARN